MAGDDNAKSPETAEQRFRRENGMTLDQAWEKVREWNLAGKGDEAKRGCKIILEFFPDHEAKNLLTKLESESPAGNDKKKSVAEKLGEKFTGVFEGFLKKQKKRAEEKTQEKARIASQPAAAPQPAPPVAAPPAVPAAAPQPQVVETPAPEVTTPETEAPPQAADEPAEQLFGAEESSSPVQTASQPEEIPVPEVQPAPAAAPIPVESPQPAVGTPPAPKKPAEVDDFIPPTDPVVDDERLFGALGYGWIFCIIPLFLKKDSIFVQFHAKQGLVMAILLTVFDFTVGSLVNWIAPGFGFFLKIIYIGVLGYAAFSAYQGKYWKVPGVYKISRKINF